MKTFYSTMIGVFTLTALITHIWTVILAFTLSGWWGGILTLFLPLLSELYWMVNQLGHHDAYSFLVLVHLILAAVLGFSSRN